MEDFGLSGLFCFCVIRGDAACWRYCPRHAHGSAACAGQEQAMSTKNAQLRPAIIEKKMWECTIQLFIRSCGVCTITWLSRGVRTDGNEGDQICMKLILRSRHIRSTSSCVSPVTWTLNLAAERDKHICQSSHLFGILEGTFEWDSPGGISLGRATVCSTSYTPGSTGH